MKSIKTKILVSMIATVTLSLALVGAVTIYLNYSSLNSTLEQTMTETAGIAADRISQQLQAYENIAFETGSISRLSEPSVSVEAKKEIIDQRVVNYGLQRGNVLGIDGISIFDGKDYSDRNYFKEAVKGQPYVSEPLVSKITGELSIMVAAPIWEDGVLNGKVAGVVYFVPKETFLNEIVGSIHFSENSMAYILNKPGDFIAHNDIELVKSKENIVSRSKEDKAYIAQAEILGKMIAGEKGFDSYTYAGVKNLLAYAPISGTDGWSIGIEAPNKDFMESAVMSVVITVILLCAAILVSVCVAFSLASGIGGPVKACAKRLVLLGEGDLGSPVIKIKNKDETGILADATSLIAARISSMIRDMIHVMEEMGKGNFIVEVGDKELYSGDFMPLAEAIEAIRDQLTNTLVQISQSADQVSSGADQVSSGAQALSQGTTEQASAVEQLAASISEIAGQVRDTAHNAREVNEKSAKMGNEMSVSNDKMLEMEKAMDNINQGSAQIGKILNTIEDIAFQTNILALNAAVEAARAGAAGKGFAVVADEVRNLATKSQEASKQTAVLIEGSIGSVAEGMRIMGETAAVLASAVKDAREVSRAIDKISAASEEQSQSIIQITQGVDQISSVVQTNSATAEESAAASEELSGQAQIMKDLVEHFQLRV